MSAVLPLMILDNIADPVFAKDKNHRWIYVNQAFCDLMGRTREELLGRSDFDFLDHAEASIFWAKDEEVLRSRTTNVNQELLTDQSGKTRTIITKKALFDRPDNPDGPALVGIIRDVTEATEANRALQAIRDTLELRVEERTREVQDAEKKLHQSDRLSTLGSLTGGIAHDFNNLLSVILLTNEELAHRHDIPKDALALVQNSTRAVLQAGKLTRSLLAYARRQPLQPVPTDVADLLERNVSMLGRTLGPGIQMNVHRQGGPWVCKIDAGQLESAIVNLCVNARDAMPSGGAITLTISSDAERVTLSVQDTGSGIHPDDLPRVFDPFFTTKGSHHGTGLGLSTVHGFVHQSGGTISAHSEVGIGTTFTLHLPACAETPASNIVAEVQVESLRVLVLDDQDAVLQSTTRVLERLGHQPTGGCNRSEIQAALVEPFDLLVADVMLEDGPTGPDVAALVRHANPRCGVIFMSGYEHEALAKEWAGGSYVFLAKPFSRADLKAAIAAAVDTHASDADKN
ncbi:MAG: ATP-binding protein [Myxococcota bacterium]